MRKSKHLFPSACLVVITFLFHGIAWDAQADRSSREPPVCCLLRADRLFDGIKLHTDAALLLTKDKVAQLGTIEQLENACHRKLELGDATILPGFIESHAHITFQNVSPLTVLRHGVTTVRDVGGPLLAPMGGDGTLRLLSSGPIIQAPNGYPLNIFGGGSGGYDQIGIPVATPSEARTVVQHLVKGSAAVIKIALEPGGEEGAPWSMTHGHHAPPATPWPMLSLDTVQAIVNEAHALGKRVVAHVSENKGVALALDGGVDEWAHVPCATIDEDVLQRAVDQGITIVTTIDTLGACKGIHANTMRLAAKGAHFIYSSEIGHTNVPWGINGEELQVMLHLTTGDSLDLSDVINIIQAATSKAGENLGIPLLGKLTPGAPADVIAVRGNAFERFKLLEYPDLVISGGRVIVNHFE